ncbi:MAG: CoA synthetase [Proteobacteria bacterium]|nr:CoA synthetase [Pseudomonadota bacterium]
MSKAEKASAGEPAYAPEEFMICVMARLLEGLGHVSVGALSPIPGCAALLAREVSGAQEAGTEAASAGPGQGNNKRRGGPKVRQGQKTNPLRVSIIHGDANNPFTDGGREIFDCAGQGRIDAFFLGGAQIDGGANINLLGVGPYPKLEKRFPGSFGSAYMYFTVPNVILFAPEHSRRVLVERVDFISAPGTSPPGMRRPGGPKALVTGLCLMSFEAENKRFRLRSVHPGHTLEEIRDNTGFDFDLPDGAGEIVPETPEPEPERLEMLRSTIAAEIVKTYPGFAARVFQCRA